MITLLFLGQISGIRLCAVVSGSMEPNLPTWSLSIVNTKASYDSIQTGDIVVYYRRSDHTHIIHRMTEIKPNRINLRYCLYCCKAGKAAP